MARRQPVRSHRYGRVRGSSQSTSFGARAVRRAHGLSSTGGDRGPSFRQLSLSVSPQRREHFGLSVQSARKPLPKRGGNGGVNRNGGKAADRLFRDLGVPTL